MRRRLQVVAIGALVAITLATGALAEDSGEVTASGVSVTVSAPASESRDVTASSVSVTTRSTSDDDSGSSYRSRYDRDDDDRDRHQIRSGGHEMSETGALVMIAIVLGLVSVAALIVYVSDTSGQEPSSGGGGRLPAPPTAGSDVVEAVANFTCECGRPAKLPLSRIEESVTCAGCGKVNRLTQASIAEVKAAAVEAYRAAHAATVRGAQTATATVDLSRR